MSKNHADAGTFDIPIERRQVYLPEFLKYSGPSRCHQAGRGAYDAPRWRVPSRQKEHNMHSTAYAHQLKNGEWEVRLPIPGRLLSDKHPTLHKTKEAADLWIASPDGRKWEEQKLAKYKKS